MERKTGDPPSYRIGEKNEILKSRLSGTMSGNRLKVDGGLYQKKQNGIIEFDPSENSFPFRLLSAQISIFDSFVALFVPSYLKFEG
jgi:hypothetical protein